MKTSVKWSLVSLGMVLVVFATLALIPATRRRGLMALALQGPEFSRSTCVDLLDPAPEDLARLLRFTAADLATEDAVLRQLAIHGEEALPLVLEACRDDDKARRLRALEYAGPFCSWELIEPGGAEIAAAMLEAGDHPSSEVQEAAFSKLASCYRLRPELLGATELDRLLELYPKQSGGRIWIAKALCDGRSSLDAAQCAKVVARITAHERAGEGTLVEQLSSDLATLARRAGRKCMEDLVESCLDFANDRSRTVPQTAMEFQWLGFLAREFGAYPDNQQEVMAAYARHFLTKIPTLKASSARRDTAAMVLRIAGGVESESAAELRPLVAGLWREIDKGGWEGSLENRFLETGLRWRLTPDQAAAMLRAAAGGPQLSEADRAILGARSPELIEELEAQFARSWSRKADGRTGREKRADARLALALWLCKGPDPKRAGMIVDGLLEEYGHVAVMTNDNELRLAELAALAARGDSGLKALLVETCEDPPGLELESYRRLVQETLRRPLQRLEFYESRPVKAR